MKEIETFILFNFGPNYKQIDLSQIMLKFKLVLELNTVQKRESFVLENKIKVTSGLQDDRNTMKLEINGQEIIYILISAAFLMENLFYSSI